MKWHVAADGSFCDLNLVKADVPQKCFEYFIPYVYTIDKCNGISYVLV